MVFVILSGTDVSLFKQAVLLKRIAVGGYAACRGLAVLRFGAFIRQTRGFVTEHEYPQTRFFAFLSSPGVMCSPPFP